MSYEPTLSECVEGVTYCPDDECQADNPWLFGDREPTTCRLCDAHLRCFTCGEPGVPLDDDGRCTECVKPSVRVMDAIETEFGLRLEERERANGTA